MDVIKERCSTCTNYAEDLGVCLDMTKLIFDFSDSKFNGNSEPPKVNRDSWCNNYRIYYQLDGSTEN
jgi:hypothetical protein